MYLKDPVNKQKSVSLTMMACSFIILLGLIVLNAFEIVKTVSSSMELFALTVGLYFSRRNISIGKKSVSLGDEDVK